MSVSLDQYWAVDEKPEVVAHETGLSVEEVIAFYRRMDQQMENELRMLEEGEA